MVDRNINLILQLQGGRRVSRELLQVARAARTAAGSFEGLQTASQGQSIAEIGRQAARTVPPIERVDASISQIGRNAGTTSRSIGEYTRGVQAAAAATESLGQAAAGAERIGLFTRGVRAASGALNVLTTGAFGVVRGIGAISGQAVSIARNLNLTTVASNALRGSLNLLGRTAAFVTGRIVGLGRALVTTRGAASGFAQGFAGLVAVLGTGAVINTIDNFVELDNRVRIATDGLGDAAATLDRLQAISQRTRSPLDANVTLFQRASIAADELGASQSELFQLVENVGRALAIQGGSAQQSRGALIQLSQALGSGIVRAEEFNSILEGAFPIAQAAARGLDRAGGSVARLRRLVVDGQVTSDEFFRALLSQTDQLEATFNRSNATIGQGFRALFDSLTIFVGRAAQSNGVITTIANSLIFLSQNIDLVIGGLTVLAVRAIPLAIAGLRSLTVALAGSGVGLLVTGLGLAVGALVAFRNEITLTRNSITTLGDFFSSTFEQFPGILSRIASGFREVTSSVDDTADSVSAAGIGIRGFLTVAAQTLDAVGIRIGRTGQLLRLAFDNLGVIVQDSFTQIANGIIGIFENVVDGVISLFQALGQTVTLQVSGFVTAIGNLAQAAAQAIRGNTAEAELLASQAQSIIESRLTLIGDLPGAIGDNFERNAQTDLIPRIENSAEDAARSFRDTFREIASAPLGTGFFETTLTGIFAGADRRAADRELRRLQAEQSAGQDQTLNPGQQIRTSIDGNQSGIAESGRRAATTLAEGFQEGFQTLRASVDDLGSTAANVLSNAFQRAQDAFAEFVTTGRANFSGLISSILSDLARLFFQRGVSQLFGALFGGGGIGGGVLSAVTGAGGAGAASIGGGGFGGIAGAIGSIFARQNGGSVNTGQPFLVGERGPEIFQPRTAGEIIPNQQIMQAPQAPPEVIVQVTNVTDPNEALSALSTEQGVQQVLNIIGNQSQRINKLLGVG